MRKRWRYLSEKATRSLFFLVMALKERVDEAKRIAVQEIKEEEGKRKSKKKRQFDEEQSIKDRIGKVKHKKRRKWTSPCEWIHYCIHELSHSMSWWYSSFIIFEFLIYWLSRNLWGSDRSRIFEEHCKAEEKSDLAEWARIINFDNLRYCILYFYFTCTPFPRREYAMSKIQLRRFRIIWIYFKFKSPT